MIHLILDLVLSQLQNLKRNKEWQQKFKSLTTHFDNIREESFTSTFPELRAWYENIE